MKRILQWVFVVSLAILLYERLQISLTRFFDVDEFTYLHWGADVARGMRPYIDFFLFMPPGFFSLLTPLLWIFWGKADVVIVARLLHVGIFVGLLFVVAHLFASVRSKTWRLLPVVILAFLPLPYDKFLEIRPDNLSTLLSIGGLSLAIGALMHSGQKQGRLWFWSGVCYSASLLVLPKTLPMVAVALVVALLWWMWGDRKNKGNRGKTVGLFGVGLVVPFVLFGFWVLSLGDIGRVWYSLTKLPFEANLISKTFIMEPHLFFFPNSLFYGGPGVTWGLLVNHAVWLIGLSVFLVRLFTPWVTASGDKKMVRVEMLLAGSFLLEILAFVQFFPLKHSQYLIPIAVFISFYAADGLMLFFKWIERTWGDRLTVVGVVAVLILMVVTTGDVNQIKQTWTNSIQLAQLRTLQTMIAPNEEVFDLEGRLMFWKHSYPICCLPMGQFLPFLTRKLQPIRDSLEEHRTTYIFQGDTRRLDILAPADLTYIKSHYQPVVGWGEGLWERKQP